MVKGKGWPIFTQRQYIYEREKQKNKGLISKEISVINDFEEVSDVEFRLINFEEYPESIINSFILKFPSQTDAYLASMKDPWPEMTEFTVDRIRYHENKEDETTEAIICLGAPRFLKDVADRLGIALINFEWGPFRLPSYRRTAYFDFKGSICDGEMLDRYKDFLKIKGKIPLLNKKELLGLFLNDVSILSKPDIVPQYKAGLALGYNVPTAYTIHNQVTMTEVLDKVHQYYSDQQIAVRYHPGDPAHARLLGPQCIDWNISLIDFIRNCERIVCISSNVAFEAMLWNRPIYDVGATQYGAVSNHSLDKLTDNMPSDEFLNFIAFGYLIPFEMLKNVEYIRWRLTRPDEEEIYLYHLKYYMDCLGIPYEILSFPREERLKEIVRYRGELIDVDMNDNYESNDLTYMFAINQRLNVELKKRQEENHILNDRLLKANKELEYNLSLLEVANRENEVLKKTLSWRITKPLRVIGRIISKIQ